MKKFLCLLCLLLVTRSVSAEPAPALRAFMNEPASIFDIGMMRLAEWAEDRTQYWTEENKLQVIVDYSISNNVDFHGTWRRDQDESAAHARCVNFIDRFRELLVSDKFFVLRLFFPHWGQVLLDDQLERMEDADQHIATYAMLADQITLTCFIDFGSGSVVARANLLDEDYFIQVW